MDLQEITRQAGLNRTMVTTYLSGVVPVTSTSRAVSGRPRMRVVDEVTPLIDAILRADAHRLGPRPGGHPGLASPTLCV